MLKLKDTWRATPVVLVIFSRMRNRPVTSYTPLPEERVPKLPLLPNKSGSLP